MLKFFNKFASRHGFLCVLVHYYALVLKFKAWDRKKVIEEKNIGLFSYSFFEKQKRKKNVKLQAVRFCMVLNGEHHCWRGASGVHGTVSTVSGAPAVDIQPAANLKLTFFQETKLHFYNRDVIWY